MIIIFSADAFRPSFRYENKPDEYIEIDDLNISKSLKSKIISWNKRYQDIVQMDEQDRLENMEKIKELDNKGLLIVKMISKELNIVVKYYSEGLFKYLEKTEKKEEKMIINKIKYFLRRFMKQKGNTNCRVCGNSDYVYWKKYSKDMWEVSDYSKYGIYTQEECPCCGCISGMDDDYGVYILEQDISPEFQFMEDYDYKTVREYRKRLLAKKLDWQVEKKNKGKKGSELIWFKKRKMPKGWSMKKLKKQMEEQVADYWK